MAVHTPVLLEKTMEYLRPREDGAILIDATVGEGGHSHAFLSAFPGLRVYGLDADREILEEARLRLGEFGDRVRLFPGRSQDFFANYPEDLEKPDRILIDLGISVYHYEKSQRGFSFSRDEYLDMRIDTSEGESAAALLRRISERDLADLLYRNAEERFSRRIAKNIVQARALGPIESSLALAEIVARSLPGKYRHGPIHPATRTFQALRIAVNGELSQLEPLLEGALDALKPRGRLGVISFHSLEDRIVKLFFRKRASPAGEDSPTMKVKEFPDVTILTRKPALPDQEEILRNPPSRSAKLRVAEKSAREVI